MEKEHARNTVVIAVIDDEASIRTALSSLLKCSGFQVQCYCSAVDFLRSSAPSTIHCIVSDIQMPGISGIDMVEQLVAQGFHIPVIFISAFTGMPQHVRADLPGLAGCLKKPFDADQLLACIDSALNPRL